MTRRFLQDIRTDISTLMADNNTGDFTLALDRQLRTDTLDSNTTLRAELFSPAAQPGVIVPNTFTAIGNYQETNGGDATYLIANAVAGTITTGVQVGWDYNLVGQIQVEADNGAGFEVGIAAGGTVVSFIAGITGRGAGNPVTAIVYADVFGGAANASVDLRIRNINGGTETITIGQISLRVSLLPTETPPPP